jgi:O-antigen/teichoic acid export membrane protein
MSTLTHAKQRSAAAGEEEALEGLKRVSLLQGLYEDGSVLLCASVFGNGMNYFFMLFLARQLGTEDFGLYALGLTIFNALLLVAIAGVDTGTIKFVSEYRAKGQADAARRAIATAVILVTSLGLITALGLFLSATPLSVQLYGKPGLTIVLLWFAVALPCALLGSLLLSSMQAMQTVRYTVGIKYLWEPIGKWVLAGLALWGGFGLGGVICGFAVTFAVSVVFAIVTLARRGWLTARDFTGIGQQDIRNFGVFCLPLVVANLFGVLAPRADIMILGYWVSSHDVGLYLAAFQTSAILSLILGAFDVVFAPTISRAWAAKDRATFQESYELVHRVALAASMPLCVLLVLFAGDVLSVFGVEFATAGPILAILTIGHLVNASSGCANTVLLMSGHSRVVLVNTVVYGTILIGITAAMIPLWGPVGAACAASGSFVLLNGLRVAQVWRLHRMLPWTWAIVKPLAAGCTMGLAIWLVKPYLTPLAYVPAGLLACGVYIAVLHVARLEASDAMIWSALAARIRVAAGWAR